VAIRRRAKHDRCGRKHNRAAEKCYAAWRRENRLLMSLEERSAGRMPTKKKKAGKRKRA
jgi:hypothetical protein